MSYADTVFKAMPFDREVSAEHLQQITHISIPDIGVALSLLAKSGVIEETVSNHFIKNRKYKTKQKELFPRR